MLRHSIIVLLSFLLLKLFKEKSLKLSIHQLAILSIVFQVQHFIKTQ